MLHERNICVIWLESISTNILPSFIPIVHPCGTSICPCFPFILRSKDRPLEYQSSSVRLISRTYGILDWTQSDKTSLVPVRPNRLVLVYQLGPDRGPHPSPNLKSVSHGQRRFGLGSV